MKRIRMIQIEEEVCENCQSTRDKFYVHLETPGRVFYWCDMDCFELDAAIWSISMQIAEEKEIKPRRFIEALCQSQDFVCPGDAAVPF